MPKTAKCERTGKAIPIEDGFFVAEPGTGSWQFIAKGSPENHGDYDIAVSDLIKSPESLVDWLAHLRQKSWFDPAAFFDFFVRFRKDNSLFGG